MLITDTLDVAIGLTLVYLIISLAMTSLSEMIEGVFKKRAVSLERAISELLHGDASAVKALYEHPLISALYPGVYPAQNKATDLSETAKLKSRWLGKNLPSYIPRDIFSATILDIESNNGLTSQMAKALNVLAASVGFDPTAKRLAIESWYDASMDRAAGWYRRRTQGRLFWLALPLSIVANVNSVVIADYLVHAPDARKAAAAIGESAAQRAPGWANGTKDETDSGAVTSANAQAGPIDGRTEVRTPDPTAPGDQDKSEEKGGGSNETATRAERDQYAADYTTQLKKIGLPIGWQQESRTRTLALVLQSDTVLGWLAGATLLTMGYFLTALAVMLGAPFWFDMLDRLVVVRSTIKPKEKSLDEASKDRSAAPGSDGAVVGQTSTTAVPGASPDAQIFG